MTTNEIANLYFNPFKQLHYNPFEKFLIERDYVFQQLTEKDVFFVNSNLIIKTDKFLVVISEENLRKEIYWLYTKLLFSFTEKQIYLLNHINHNLNCLENIKLIDDIKKLNEKQINELIQVIDYLEKNNNIEYTLTLNTKKYYNGDTHCFDFSYTSINNGIVDTIINFSFYLSNFERSLKRFCLFRGTIDSLDFIDRMGGE